MNLHGLAIGAISAVNPVVSATVRRNLGYITMQDGSRTPNMFDSTANVQVQALSSDELKFMDAQGIQGNLRAVYLFGNWGGIIKADRIGGDMLIFDNHKWLCVTALENWPDWCKIIVRMQDAII